MPGVDFRLLRERIQMQDVLQLLQFEPTFRRGDSNGPRESDSRHTASLKEAELSSGFPRFFLLVCPGTGRTLCAEASSFVFLNFVVIARCW